MMTGIILHHMVPEELFVYKSQEDILENIIPTVDVIEVIKPVYNYKASGINIFDKSVETIEENRNRVI